MPLLNCVSTGVVGERADVLPFTCVAIETVRQSEIGRTDVFVLPSPRVTEPRRGLFLPYESLPFRRCRLPLVVSAVSDPRRHPFDAVV